MHQLEGRKDGRGQGKGTRAGDLKAIRINSRWKTQCWGERDPVDVWAATEQGKEPASLRQGEGMRRDRHLGLYPRKDSRELQRPRPVKGTNLKCHERRG